ncbi:MAG: hypothetical protein HYY40_07125 [Bacteroidetes bacterium]|nr:hypothetical protein [Bacteroidota bacterium]
MKKRILLPVIFFCHAISFGQSNQAWMFGPMLHVNFGGGKIKPSFALEVSWWNYHGFPYSFDFAIELEKQKLRFYAEGQTGIGLAGLSAGPLVEYNSGDKTFSGGFQGSLWANYFFGIDVRMRGSGGQFFFCPGAYLKLPGAIFSPNEDGDSNDWDFDWD